MKYASIGTMSGKVVSLTLVGPRLGERIEIVHLFRPQNQALVGDEMHEGRVGRSLGKRQTRKLKSILTLVRGAKQPTRQFERRFGHGAFEPDLNARRGSRPTPDIGTAHIGNQYLGGYVPFQQGEVLAGADELCFGMDINALRPQVPCQVLDAIAAGSRNVEVQPQTGCLAA